MSPARVGGRRHAARTVRWLTAVALTGLALATATATVVTTTAQAQAAGHAVVGRRAAGPLSAPIPIAINTKNWTARAGFDSRRPAWYMDGSGVVHLQGAAKQTNDITATAPRIGTLPSAARPARDVYTVAHTYLGTFAGVEIDTAGDIFAIIPGAPAVKDFSFVSLEGITYKPGGQGIAISLNTANWTGAVSGTGAPAWYQDSSGVVHLQGGVGQISTSGSGSNTIGTLPGVAAPAQAVYTIVNNGEGDYADLAIETNGSIDLIDPRPPAAKNYFLVSLESITFRPAALAGHPIPLNTANWSGNAGFGSRAPSWFTDKAGLVHLEGAVTQTNASGSGANLIGTLPAAAAPTHTVYAIVHTFNGTYADLAVLPNGQLALIDPRPPMVKDYTFVSLEGLSYRR